LRQIPLPSGFDRKGDRMTSYLVAIRWHSGRHEVIAECDDVRFPDFDRSKLRAPFRELPLAGGERDSCVLVVRDEVEPCIGAGLRTWFEGDAKEAQFFILRYAQDWKTIYRLLAHPAAK
jgi:hypothetical protein